MEEWLRQAGTQCTAYGNACKTIEPQSYYVLSLFDETTQRAHDFIQRRLNVDATSRRRIDIETTLYKHHMPAWQAFE